MFDTELSPAQAFKILAEQLDNGRSVPVTKSRCGGFLGFQVDVENPESQYEYLEVRLPTDELPLKIWAHK